MPFQMAISAGFLEAVAFVVLETKTLIKQAQQVHEPCKYPEKENSDRQKIKQVQRSWGPVKESVNQEVQLERALGPGKNFGCHRKEHGKPLQGFVQRHCMIQRTC